MRTVAIQPVQEMNHPGITQGIKGRMTGLCGVEGRESQAVLLIDSMHDFQDFNSPQLRLLPALIFKRPHGFYLENLPNKKRQYLHRPGRLGIPPPTLHFLAFVGDLVVHIPAQVQICHNLGDDPLMTRPKDHLQSHQHLADIPMLLHAALPLQVRRLRTLWLPANLSSTLDMPI